MTQSPGEAPVSLSEQSGAVVAEESEQSLAQIEADRQEARRAAAASNPQDAPQQEAIGAIQGDEEFRDGEWHGHANHKCPHCHVAFLDIQGGSQAVRVHLRSAHRGA